MRVELEPLGVRVVTSIIGAVDTPIFKNSHPDAFQMPADSYYQPVRSFLEDARKGKLQPPNPEAPDVTARHLVDDILGGNKSFTWRGTMGSICRYLSAWLPIWALDTLNNGKRGVPELKRYYTS